jgi:hypothetical protein
MHKDFTIIGGLYFPREERREKREERREKREERREE